MNKEHIKQLVENKETIIAQKKAEMKRADGFSYIANSTAQNVTKADSSGDMVVTAIINTTNFMDSHKDVHLPGIWTKSLKENRNIMHLQEHELKFDKIIADGKDLKASAKSYTWKELGFDFSGNTEGLVFESTVKPERNKFMYDQYRKGNVKNHSVGMQYVKLLLAVNDEEYGAEFEAWEKYYPEIANKQTADEEGYFWVVKEAKIIEGSAVPIGSNTATPTHSIQEPEKSTHDEEAANKHFNFEKEIKTIKIF